LDLLMLANALVVDRENALATVPEAVERLGAGPLSVLLERLTAKDFRRVPENDRVLRAVRRASLAAAVSAGRYAERFGVTRDRAGRPARMRRGAGPPRGGGSPLDRGDRGRGPDGLRVPGPGARQGEDRLKPESLRAFPRCSRKDGETMKKAALVLLLAALAAV